MFGNRGHKTFHTIFKKIPSKKLCSKNHRGTIALRPKAFASFASSASSAPPAYSAPSAPSAPSHPSDPSSPSSPSSPSAPRPHLASSPYNPPISSTQVLDLNSSGTSLSYSTYSTTGAPSASLSDLLKNTQPNISPNNDNCRDHILINLPWDTFKTPEGEVIDQIKICPRDEFDSFLKSSVEQPVLLKDVLDKVKKNLTMRGAQAEKNSHLEYYFAIKKIDSQSTLHKNISAFFSQGHKGYQMAVKRISNPSTEEVKLKLEFHKDGKHLSERILFHGSATGKPDQKSPNNFYIRRTDKENNEKIYTIDLNKYAIKFFPNEEEHSTEFLLKPGETVFRWALDRTRDIL